MMSNSTSLMNSKNINQIPYFQTIPIIFSGISRWFLLVKIMRKNVVVVEILRRMPKNAEED